MTARGHSCAEKTETSLCAPTMLIYRVSFRPIFSSAQGIEAEIPEELRSNFEELERKARFLRAGHAKMRPAPARKK
jgi:hypothetical protein